MITAGLRSSLDVRLGGCCWISDLSKVACKRDKELYTLINVNPPEPHWLKLIDKFCREAVYELERFGSVIIVFYSTPLANESDDDEDCGSTGPSKDLKDDGSAYGSTCAEDDVSGEEIAAAYSETTHDEKASETDTTTEPPSPSAPSESDSTDWPYHGLIELFRVKDVCVYASELAHGVDYTTTYTVLRKINSYEHTQFDLLFDTLLAENHVTRLYINLEIENTYDLAHTVDLAPFERGGGSK